MCLILLRFALHSPLEHPALPLWHLLYFPAPLVILAESYGGSSGVPFAFWVTALIFDLRHRVFLHCVRFLGEVSDHDRAVAI